RMAASIAHPRDGGVTPPRLAAEAKNSRRARPGIIIGPMARAPFVGAILILGAGCAATVPLDRAVMAYDGQTADSMSLPLLLNIPRARNNQPMHFTGISSIAATYKYAFNGGLGPALTGDKGWLVLPTLGGLSEENPTISLAPMQGDEFTQRLLTPFPEERLTLLLRQGYDVDALLRLLGAEIRMRDASGE